KSRRSTLAHELAALLSSAHFRLKLFTLAELMAQALLDLVNEHFATSVLATHRQHGDETMILKAEAWFSVHQFLYENAISKMDMLIDLTVVDYPDRDPRFEVVTHLMSLSKGHRLRLKACVGDEEGDDAVLDTLTGIWASANWMEREAYDLFGVHFSGHPD